MLAYDIPNSKNFCGGNFQDWLEVNLIDTCNARCSWCIERGGYHPEYHAPVEEIARVAIGTGKTNIILLGGEPLLYKQMKELVRLLAYANRKVWITTNGFLLTSKYVMDNLIPVTGVNISIHHFNMENNKQVTKVMIDEHKLREAINALHFIHANVRMNCNVISGQIDTPEKIISYVKWAKNILADKIRFAELKQDDEGFVDLAAILNHKYGLNDNPFTHGCNSDCVIEGVPVNFRQMCGLQTSRRTAPLNPKQYAKEVLYYDGKLYDGWQTMKKENKEMGNNEVINILETIRKANFTDDELQSLKEFLSKLLFDKASRGDYFVEKPSHSNSADFGHATTSGGCQY